MRRTMLLALCAVFLSSASYAQLACTEIGCVNGLIIRPDGIDWPAGHYVIQFLIDDKTMVDCGGTLPLKSCEKGPSFRCNAQGVTIGESGCALPVNAHGLADIRIEATPRKVVMNISRDGAPFLSRTFKPGYITAQPNGPHCEPVCTSATVFLNEDHLRR